MHSNIDILDAMFLFHARSQISKYNYIISSDLDPTV